MQVILLDDQGNQLYDPMIKLEKRKIPKGEKEKALDSEKLLLSIERALGLRGKKRNTSPLRRKGRCVFSEVLSLFFLGLEML